MLEANCSLAKKSQIFSKWNYITLFEQIQINKTNQHTKYFIVDF